MEKKKILVINNVTNREEKLDFCLAEDYEIVFIREEDEILEQIKKMNFEIASILVNMINPTNDLTQFMGIKKTAKR